MIPSEQNATAGRRRQRGAGEGPSGAPRRRERVYFYASARCLERRRFFNPRTAGLPAASRLPPPPVCPKKAPCASPTPPSPGALSLLFLSGIPIKRLDRGFGVNCDGVSAATREARPAESLARRPAAGTVVAAAKDGSTCAARLTWAPLPPTRAATPPFPLLARSPPTLQMLLDAQTNPGAVSSLSALSAAIGTPHCHSSVAGFDSERPSRSSGAPSPSIKAL